MRIDPTEQELANQILQNPLDDQLRIRLENHLAGTAPDSVDLRVLQLERQIAEALDAEAPIDDLIGAYQQLRVSQSNYFWDMRGCLYHLFRPYSLWLTFCNPIRSFALDLAIQSKTRQQFNLNVLPVEIVQGRGPDGVYELKDGILDFVKRDRGPSGKEPELADDEIKFVMRASNSTKQITKRNADKDNIH